MADICEFCKLPQHEKDVSTNGCLEAQAKAMKSLLNNIGDPGDCRGCKAPIYWVTHRNGKKTPYTSAGLNHFIDCPARDQFKRPKP